MLPKRVTGTEKRSKETEERGNSVLGWFETSPGVLLDHFGALLDYSGSPSGLVWMSLGLHLSSFSWAEEASVTKTFFKGNFVKITSLVNPSDFLLQQLPRIIDTNRGGASGGERARAGLTCVPLVRP